jgi:adenylate cyclase
VVLLLDDLQWFDAQSVTFLTALLPTLSNSRTLALVNFRSDFAAKWLSDMGCVELRLQPLDGGRVHRLLSALLGPDPSLAPLPEHLMARTSGNPFFIEEVLRGLIEEGALEGEPGRYRLVRAIGETRVPATVQAVLAARIDRLPESEKHILQIAAVVGRTFSEPVVCRVAGHEELGEPLDNLCVAEFLQAKDDDYQFWHPLTQEVAYGSMLGDRRCRIHGAVARAIVELEPDRLDERSALVASHYERAKEGLETARWSARAASWAARTDLDEAMRRWRALVEQLRAVPESEERLLLGIRARARLLQLGARTGMSTEEASRFYVEGKELAADDPVELIAITEFHGSVQFGAGQLQRALECFVEAARLSEATGDVELQAAVGESAPFLYGYTGPLAKGLSQAEKVIALCAGDLELGVKHQGHSPLVRASLARAELLARAGRLSDARRQTDWTLAAAKDRSEAETVCWALSHYPHLANFVGEEADSLARGGEAVQIAEDSGNGALRVLALQSLGIAQLLAGQTEAAVFSLDEALTQMRDHRLMVSDQASVLSHLALARLAVGAGDSAKQTVEEALAVATRQGARVFECLALLTRAKVLLATEGSHDRCLADLEAALDLVAETGAVTYKPFILEWLGRCQDGDLGPARALFSAIGATGHAKRLELSC